MFQSFQGGNINISNSWRQKKSHPPTTITFNPQTDAENLDFEFAPEFTKDCLTLEILME